MIKEKEEKTKPCTNCGKEYPLEELDSRDGLCLSCFEIDVNEVITKVSEWEEIEEKAIQLFKTGRIFNQVCEDLATELNIEIKDGEEYNNLIDIVRHADIAIKESKHKPADDPTVAEKIEDSGNGIVHQLGQEETEQTIELDCAPGDPRPDVYLPGILEGTGIEPVEKCSAIFGNWTFNFSHVPKEKWKECQPIFKERIKELHSKGYIRYGSW